MNKGRALTYKLLRTYCTVRRKDASGVYSKVALANDEKVNLDNLELEDLDEYDIDYMKLGNAYDMHERERAVNRTKLRRQIVARKEFKAHYPNFLTFVEKQQIQKLHEDNPEEWTIERLSESFPALPHTIQKIIKSKWVPDSVEKVVTYDNKVVKNWELFRKGKLPLDTELASHLTKFKDRKITAADRRLLAERLVPPKFEIPKPKSSFFSSLVQKSVIQNESKVAEQKFLSPKDTVGANYNEYNQYNSKHNSSVALKVYNREANPHKNWNKQVTFAEFASDNIEATRTRCPVEGQLLSDAYEQHIATNVKNMKNNESLTKNLIVNHKQSVESNVSTVYTEFAEDNVEEATWKKSATEEKPFLRANEQHIISNMESNESLDEDLIVNDEHCIESSISSTEEVKNLPHTPVSLKDNNVDTYIKAWSRKTNHLDAYATFIKIPKKLYKEGMIYRVNDSYYDDDGEFLYRTPGLRG